MYLIGTYFAVAFVESVIICFGVNRILLKVMTDVALVLNGDAPSLNRNPATLGRAFQRGPEVPWESSSSNPTRMTSDRSSIFDGKLTNPAQRYFRLHQVTNNELHTQQNEI